MYTFIERKCCPVCGGVDVEKLYVEPFASGATGRFLEAYYEGRLKVDLLGDAVYELERCAVCLLIYQRFVLDSEGLEFLYEKAIDPEASLAKRTSADKSYSKGLSQDAGYVARFFKTKRASDLDVLDFGMGWGHWCVAARAHGYNVYGAELSENRRKYAQESGVQLCSPLDENNDQRFDFINTDQVFEHLTNPLEILLSLSEKLNQGGILKIFVPDTPKDYRSMKLGGWQPGKDAFHPLEHVNGFSQSSVDYLIRQAGLRPVTLKEILGAKGLRAAIAWLRRAKGNPNWFFKKD